MELTYVLLASSGAALILLVRAILPRPRARRRPGR
jgi:hypothetical protein